MEPILAVAGQIGHCWLLVSVFGQSNGDRVELSLGLSLRAILGNRRGKDSLRVFLGLEEPALLEVLNALADFECILLGFLFNCTFWLLQINLWLYWMDHLTWSRCLWDS